MFPKIFDAFSAKSNAAFASCAAKAPDTPPAEDDVYKRCNSCNIVFCNSACDLNAALPIYTIGYVPQGIKPNPRPQLTIKGRWLEQIGFYVGSPVIIKIEQGKLIIEIDLRV